MLTFNQFCWSVFSFFPFTAGRFSVFFPSLLVGFRECWSGPTSAVTTLDVALYFLFQISINPWREVWVTFVKVNSFTTWHMTRPYSFNSLQWRHTQTQWGHRIIARCRVYPLYQFRLACIYYAPITDLSAYVTAQTWMNRVITVHICFDNLWEKNLVCKFVSHFDLVSPFSHQKKSCFLRNKFYIKKIDTRLL